MKLKDRNGILYPSKMKFSSWIVVGPPCTGKSYLIEKIGGYPNEVAIDISEHKWWKVEPLTHRPREIHLALPFKGFDGGYSVYDDKWKGTEEFPELDFDRMFLLKKKDYLYEPPPKYPAVNFELSLVIPERRFFEEIRETVFSASNLVRKVEFLDVYYSDDLIGSKSLSILIEFRSEEKTLDTNESRELQDRVVQVLADKGFRLREA